MGWLLSEASIRSVVVGFQYTLVASHPDSSRVTKTSKNQINSSLLVYGVVKTIINDQVGWWGYIEKGHLGMIF